MSDSTGRLEMRVGALVILGMAVTVLLILISDSISFEGSYRVRVILDDAAGLNPGSPVKLDGLTIGHIETISAYQDPLGRGSIRADAIIDNAFTIDAASKLLRKTDGIFGDGHLSFEAPAAPTNTSLKKDGKAEVVAAESFLDEATVHLKAIVGSVHDLLNDENRANIGRMLAAGAMMSEEGTELVKDLKVRSRQIGQLATKADTMIDGLTLAQADLTDKAGTGMTELQATLKSLREQVDKLGKASTGLAMTADKAFAKADKLLTMMNTLSEESQPDLAAIRGDARSLAAIFKDLAADIKAGKGVLGQLLVNAAMAKDVNDILIAGEQLAERIADDPSILIWGPAPEDRDMARDHREEEKLRRAFMEGFDRNPPIRFQHDRGEEKK